MATMDLRTFVTAFFFSMTHDEDGDDQHSLREVEQEKETAGLEVLLEEPEDTEEGVEVS